jgi:hypothetical protein
MKFLREVVGIILIFAAWLNPFGLEMMVRLAIFIIGFDCMSIFPKIAIFAADFFIGFFHWLGFTLLILVGAESVLMLSKKKQDIGMAVKPACVFLVAFISLGLQPALIAAGIDLLLNIGIGK